MRCVQQKHKDKDNGNKILRDAAKHSANGDWVDVHLVALQQSWIIVLAFSRWI